MLSSEEFTDKECDSMGRRKEKKAAAQYYTHGHNIEMCLSNGSYVRKDTDGRLFQYINGDYMGLINTIPKGMIEVDTALARELLPRCCK
jgi:hypothetical protein